MLSMLLACKWVLVGEGVSIHFSLYLLLFFLRYCELVVFRRGWDLAIANVADIMVLVISLVHLI